MSSATSAVTYTSVYTDFEPDRAFWGANDEEISEGGFPRVIVLGYDGLRMQPDSPSITQIHTKAQMFHRHHPFPLDEDEREPMFVHTHDPDYVPEPIYTEYIPLEDDHEFPTRTNNYLPDDSSSKSNCHHSHQLLNEGEDDDGDSFLGNDADWYDEDDEDEEEEEEEHLAPADSAIVVPVDEPVFPTMKGTEPDYTPPPSMTLLMGLD
ncbi:hypothetical protein Tco_1437336 [Tanacetum coccineum]